MIEWNDIEGEQATKPQRIAVYRWLSVNRAKLHSLVKNASKEQASRLLAILGEIAANEPKPDEERETV